MQQDQDIKGFTLLELIVVIVIIGLISAVAYPNFMSWKQERELRLATEKVTNMIANLSTQVSRGSFSYAQLMIKPISGKSPIFFTKGMRNSKFSEIINKGDSPGCKITNTGTWSEINSSNTVTIDKVFYNNYIEYFYPEEGLENYKFRVQFSNASAVCFGKSGNYYKPMEALKRLANGNQRVEGVDTSNYIIICTAKHAGTGNTCKKGATDIEKPAYLIKWSRFGNVSKYKWSKNSNTNNGSWIRQ